MIGRYKGLNAKLYFAKSEELVWMGPRVGPNWSEYSKASKGSTEESTEECQHLSVCDQVPHRDSLDLKVIYLRGLYRRNLLV
ncbi:hypothetical protein Avbf_13568 [Armadillidium vulgare]|nr:hypothetical protein Avbf_13568 [Armadillidium vulgare]